MNLLKTWYKEGLCPSFYFGVSTFFKKLLTFQRIRVIDGQHQKERRFSHGGLQTYSAGVFTYKLIKFFINRRKRGKSV